MAFKTARIDSVAASAAKPFLSIPLDKTFTAHLNAAAASNTNLNFVDIPADYDQLSEDYKKLAGGDGPANGKQLGDFLINHECRGKRKGLPLLNFDDFMNFAKPIKDGARGSGAGYGNAIGTYSEGLGVNKPTRLWIFNNGSSDPDCIVVDDSEGTPGVQTEIDGIAFAGELAKLMNSNGTFSKKDFLTYMLKFQ